MQTILSDGEVTHTRRVPNRLPPHLLPIAGIDVRLLFPFCAGGGVVCAENWGTPQALDGFYRFPTAYLLPFTLSSPAVQAF